MSYPTQENTRWERHPQAMTIAPRKQRMDRSTNAFGKGDREPELPKAELLDYWHQILVCPCDNPTVFLYSMFCCCCAMGDIGCIVHEAWYCYAAYCVCALCPCSIGSAREAVAEKYNLPVSQWEPDDCGWCLVKCIGMRLLCVVSVCLFPCFHVAQMRAEVAYRQHGEASVCPCCCFNFGGGSGPPSKDTKLDYPRNSGSPYVQGEKEPPRTKLDYPRAGECISQPQERFPAASVQERPLADYPRASAYSYPPSTVNESKAQLDYPRN